jgi:alkanesulfonate monooxygenase SsuD/methylene tetrahydromethanopterin reductase-like flavin-dependent oxidoreductase (luciferase family)
MIGTNAAGNRVLGLAARYADAVNVWTVWMKNRPEDVPTINERIDAACVAIGREPASLQRTVAIRIDLPGRLPKPGEAISPISGSLPDIAETLNHYAELGVSHVNVWLEPNTRAGIEAFAPVLEMVNGPV